MGWRTTLFRAQVCLPGKRPAGRAVWGRSAGARRTHKWGLTLEPTFSLRQVARYAGAARPTPPSPGEISSRTTQLFGAPRSVLTLEGSLPPPPSQWSGEGVEGLLMRAVQVDDNKQPAGCRLHVAKAGGGVSFFLQRQPSFSNLPLSVYPF
jgi:hypothetical protein